MNRNMSSRPALTLPRGLNLSSNNRPPSVSPQIGETAEDDNQAAPALPTPSATASTNVTQPARAATQLEITGTEGSILGQISREHLQCPVCFDVIRMMPIYQCRNGHTICNSCIDHLTNCPMCRCCIMGTRIRNRALETMMEFVQVTCPYRSKGCMKMMKSLSMRQHVLECQYGKFIWCPGLGFESCQEQLCSDNWKYHISEVHHMNVEPGRSHSVNLNYWDFMSSKTIKDGGIVTWQPIVLTPFPDSGPFMIKCELDIQKNFMATFVCIYSPPIPTGSEADANELEVMNGPFFIELCISEPYPLSITRPLPAERPAQISWKGEPMLLSEYRNGSKKGVFKIPLSEYRYVEPPTDLPNTSQRNPTANLGATAGPSNHLLPLSYLSLPVGHANPPAPSQNESGASSMEPLLPPRRRTQRQVKQDLLVKVRISKTQSDLEKPWSSDLASFTIHDHSIIKAATYRASKCDGCKEGPIKGTRYRCMECPKFDLCSKCMHEKDVHNHHYFAYVRNTEQNTRLGKNFKRLFREGPSENGEEGDAETTVAPPKRARNSAAGRVSTNDTASTTAGNSATSTGPVTATTSASIAPPS